MAVWLIAGLLVVLYGRAEPEANHNARSSKISDQVSNIDQSLPNQLPPLGDHRDRHGCYHNHSPFTVASSLFICQVSFSSLITGVFSPPLLLSSAVILHPPRA
jgi:hypothetical protein